MVAPECFARGHAGEGFRLLLAGIVYKGGGPAAQAIAAGEVQITRFGIGNFVGLIEGGNVKALALSSSKRSLLLPNVPIFAEVGLEGYPGQAWWGLGAPKGTPPAVLARINAEFVGMALAFAVVATLASVAGGWWP